jgi:hypothetical protein
MEITRIKKAISCKQVTKFKLDKEKASYYIPKAGDVAVFEVKTIGKHIAIQSDALRNMTILPGDQIMAAFGSRYATEQFEGYIPDRVMKKFHILGMGGAIGIIKSMNSALDKIGPTEVKIVGYAVDEKGNVINTKYLDEKEHPFSGSMLKQSSIVLSLGSSMDSGKTTTAGYLARGFKSIGKKVGYIKLTGTVFTKDRDFAYDCGADTAFDFSDLGFPSTYMCEKGELLNLYQTLLHKTYASQPDVIVIEIADGIFQRETDMLLKDKRFMSTVDGVVFSSGDSLSAVYGAQLLTELGVKPLALSGVLTMSPLLIEEVEARCEIPVCTIAQLRSPECADTIFGLLVKSEVNG